MTEPGGLDTGHSVGQAAGAFWQQPEEGEAMRSKISLLTVAIMVVVFSAGCSVEYKAEVESDTSWSGAFGNRSVDGRGNDRISLGKDHPVCCVVQKETASGFLKVRVKAEGGGLFGPGDSDWVETTAQYGVVSVCSDE
jgi:hypothetical protein